MDTRHTYGLRGSDETVSIYAPPGLKPPAHLIFEDKRVYTSEFVLLDRRSLTCGPGNGCKRGCGDSDCHRSRLGVCQCGRHTRPSVRVAGPGVGVEQSDAA